MKLLWFLLGAAVMVQARPDMGSGEKSGDWASETESIVTEDEIKPNPNYVKQDGVSSPSVSGWTENREFEVTSSSAGPEPKSRIINIDVTKPITAELSINFHQVEDPAPKPEPTCIHNWHGCGLFTKPCCGQQPTEDDTPTLGPKHFICHILGQHVCTPLSQIENLDLFAKLVDQLNGTNHAELTAQYWNSVSYPKSSSNS